MMNVTALSKARKLSIIGMLTALSTILYFIEIPIFDPLKLDLSDIGALVASLALTPIYGVVVELLKNLIHLTRTSTMGLGELANFFVGVILVLSYSIIYKRYKKVGTSKAHIIAIIVSAISIVCGGIFINAIIYPIFMKIVVGETITNAVFIAYLWSTVTVNLLKAAVTIIPTIAVMRVLDKRRI